MIYDELKSYMLKEPRARERKNKNRAIGNVIKAKYHLEMEQGKIADMVGEILNADRAWRKVLEDNKDLRGTDYWEKTDLEIKKRKELGY